MITSHFIVTNKISTQDNSKWKLEYSFVAAALAIFVILSNFLYFKNWSVDFIFLFSAFFIIILFFSLLRYFNVKWCNISRKRFEYKLFFTSFCIRFIVMIFLYILFYSITGRHFSVEAIDSIWYHESGIKIAEQISNGHFRPLDIVVGQFQFDDIGYPTFLGIIYYLFGPSVFLIRLLHCIFDSFSVLLIYKITLKLWNENTARFAALISMLFPPMLFYIGTHSKETYLLFFTLLSIYYSIKIINDKKKLFSMVILLISIGNLFLLRTVLALIIISSLLFYFFYTFFKKKNKFRNFLVIILLLCSLYGILNFFGIYKNVSTIILSLAGIETKEGIRTGGRNIEQYVMKGQSLAKYASTPLLTAISLATPFPSMVKINIRYFNQTEQWYHIGGLFIWNYLSFLAFVGIYYSIKQKFRNSLILLMVALGYITALVVSVYITSIRFNLIKMALLIIFVSIGFSKIKKHHIKYWCLYTIFISLVIIIWNYVKIAGRGYF